MELEAPFSPSIFFRCEDDEKFALCSISDLKNPNLDVKTTDKLRGRKIYTCFHGWFVLKDEEHQFSLWNPVTSEFICLPPLDFRPEQEIGQCVITSPPHESSSKFVLFEKNGKSLFFCKIGDEKWTNLCIEGDFKDDYLVETVICNGMIYGCAHNALKLVKIDLSIPDHPLIEVYDKSLFTFMEREGIRRGISLIESNNELYLLCLDMRSSMLKEVVEVHVFLLDLLTMDWKKVESVKDKAFFFNPEVGSFCYPTIGEEIKGVCFILPEDNNIYSFNMDDKTISVSLPHLDFSRSTNGPIWIMTNLRNSNGENKKDLEKEKRLDNREVVKHSSTTKEDVGGRSFDKFSLDVLSEIGKKIFLCDYVSFRSVNKNCRIACPPIHWTGAALEGIQDYNHSPPWLTYYEKGDKNFKCYDLLRSELYLMNLPSNNLRDVMMCHSRSGWCIMLRGENSIFLWNPLTKETILLPDAYNCKFADAYSLSSTIDLVCVLYCCWSNVSRMQLIFLREGIWHSEVFDVAHFEVKIGIDNNMIYYDDHIYLFDLEENLIIFKMLEVEGDLHENGEGEGNLDEHGEGEGEGEEGNGDDVDGGWGEGGGVEEFGGEFEMIHKLHSPCSSFDNCYLIECDGNIMSIFVGSWGEWIKIFTLDAVKMVWAEIENLENKTLYISRFSCFSIIPPTPEMGNRLYFPRYHRKNNNVVYYSLASKKLHAHGTDEVLDNFYNTKEQLYSCWVEVKR